MTLPKPPVALNNACSVIWDNALYTYQAGAFQRLRLEQGAAWEKLPTGEEVTGAVCVGSTPKDPNAAGLYVVGGKGKTPGYAGLQKFTYATGKWESIQPQVPVTQERTWHGATYLNATDQILMYAGNQDGAQHPSSQTFTIQATAPYEVLAFSSTAPPTISPILLPWSETQAVMVGGDGANTRVMLFDPVAGWTDSGTTLAAPIPKDVTAMKAILIKGDDGCKNLYTFDMTQAPNEVKRIVLLDDTGKPVGNSAAISARSTAEERSLEPRELTLNHWPAYNATGAPKVTRTNYAVAQDPNGLVVFSGGNDDDVVCMFDARENSWENAESRLVQQKLLVASVSPSDATPTATASSTLATRSSSPSASAEAIGTAPNSNQTADNMNPTALLGIVLGSIVALLFVLGLILFFIRRRRRRQSFLEAGHARRASGSPSNEKDGLHFANDSKPLGGMSHFRGHQPSDSQGSYSSVAILMGRVGPPKKDLKRMPSNESRRTSTSSFFNKQFKSTISKPIPQLSDHPALQSQPQPRTQQQQPQRPPTREEKGVSFAANLPTPGPAPTPRPQPRGPSALQRQGSTRRSSGWNRYWSGGSALNLLGFGPSKRTTVDSDQSSRYSDHNNRITQDSATVPAFHFQLEGRDARVKSVASGSPRVSQYQSRGPMSGKIERPVSQESFSGYSSGIPASVHDTWDPLSASKKPWGADRAPSSAYSGGASFYPGLSIASSSMGPPRPAPAPPVPPVPPIGVSRQPQLAMASTSSDMSWLNLGELGRKP